MLVLLFSLTVLGNLLTLVLRPSYLGSLLLVYPVPALINFFLVDVINRKKILVFALLTTIFFVLPIEIIAMLANAWDVKTSFPRVFGLAPIENILYAFFNVFWPLCFYKYFIEKNAIYSLSSKAKYLGLLYLLLSLIVYGFLFINPSLISLHYWQIGVLILIFPFFAIYSKRPQLLKTIIVPTLFFAAVFFMHELVSLYLGLWWWPGEYIKTIMLWNKVFPIDDVILWYFLSVPVLIGGYKFFVEANT